jgi:hypothetical protein
MVVRTAARAHQTMSGVGLLGHATGSVLQIRRAPRFNI